MAAEFAELSPDWFDIALSLRQNERGHQPAVMLLGGLAVAAVGVIAFLLVAARQRLTAPRSLMAALPDWLVFRGLAGWRERPGVLASRILSTMDDFIALLAQPLDAATAISSVLHPAAGGVDVFLGTTRSETRGD